MHDRRIHFSDRLVSRKGAWISFAASLIVMLALFGLFGGAKAPSGVDPAPPSSESA